MDEFSELGRPEHGQAPSVVDRLFASRRAGAMPEILRGLDLDSALGLQLAVSERFSDAGEPIGGWKIGMTSGRARDSMGVGFRPFGFVLASRILESGAAFPLHSIAGPVIEPELALVMGDSLTGPVTPEEAREAVRGVAPAFEIVESRCTGRDAELHATKIADGLNNWGMVVGATVAPEQVDVATTVGLTRDGRDAGNATMGVALDFDDLFLSLSRISTLLGGHGAGLEPGQVILTGAFMRIEVDTPGLWVANFDEVGDVALRFVS